MKIISVCQSGLGSSFMVQMNIQQVLKDEGVNSDTIQLEHSDVGSVTSDSADYFFVESTLTEALRGIPEVKLVPLKSLIDKEEIKQHVNKILDKENISHS
ncbi:PTS sugar transporter subunit IIB [Clostridium tyrobutyricum]|jgi:PTS system ascorbate-specific IIB component|uniref:PTS sugar transporter subunit IIB n=1 Tax=Clostridium tyrobutyricum TaxID=1519 RepID=UPI001C3874E0|nr:PTS sugar transporter subunit IIB [Clostridium tyrobutyricum]MBV4448212.1 PTS sugar transporter subunit IIB [Clostridium tyrobutyricum]MCH4199650.1 PTS sugar transporter subunit IIB [Clostridium tyrobutyricum]MCH4238473.1 PTS sugar transporter subunit IIB [Clostridium tyrobutyricum]MCH4259819.1 PTS sugar transporter subunit IIB [Clostridium tyrobutyricum]MCI1239708.1 PTS sugar transporter subunit IIB [Clostridium tyrobutyricum]